MKLRCWFLFFLVLIIGCNSNTTSIDIFFQKLDNTLSTSEKRQVRDCPDISCLEMFIHTNLSKKFSDAYGTKLADIDQILIDSFKITSPYDRQRVLVLAYQKKLTRKTVDFHEIKNEIAQFDESQDSIYSDKDGKEIRTHTGIAKCNFDRFQIGDTLNLELSLGRDGNKKVVYYHIQYNNNNFNDTLFIKCVLLKKTKKAADKLESADENYIFSLRILQANNRELELVDKKYRKDSIITLPLYYYGRIINK